MNNTVLLIEDEEKTGEILSQALQSEAIDVEWAKDGTDALGKMEKGKFDLVILDLKLPELSGDEVLREIRKVDPYVEVVVYTSYVDPPTTLMENLINLHAGGYIRKGAEADLWETVKLIKARLDPLSSDEADELLKSLPEGMFSGNDNDGE